MKKGSISQKLGVSYDFLFLFDLLAHSFGLEPTLRVLTHSDLIFYQICKPNIDLVSNLKLFEDKVKVTWSPADIERWLQTATQRSIVVDCYEVTIFSKEELVNRTITVPAKPLLKMTCSSDLLLIPGSAEADPEIKEAEHYDTWFFDLNGGRTEYVITIACIIGKSRMKGEKLVTHLVPYGPQNTRSGMVKTAYTNKVEIFWDPPNGEFTKYVLTVDKLSDKTVMKRVMENLSYKLTTYTILGLEPGEQYKIKLGTILKIMI
jgi:hypothetical protein